MQSFKLTFCIVLLALVMTPTLAQAGGRHGYHGHRHHHAHRYRSHRRYGFHFGFVGPGLGFHYGYRRPSFGGLGFGFGYPVRYHSYGFYPGYLGGYYNSAYSYGYCPYASAGHTYSPYADVGLASYPIISRNVTQQAVRLVDIDRPNNWRASSVSTQVAEKPKPPAAEDLNAFSDRVRMADK